MQRTKIDVLNNATKIMTALQKGILITSANNGRANSMTISWGALGIEWGKIIFTTYVRESRFTREFIEASKEFTVNIPVTAIDPNIIKFCGSKSGRDFDKAKELKLHLVEGLDVAAPAILELPLTLECKVLMSSLQDPATMDTTNLKWYPTIEATQKPDRHIAYHAEVVNAYIVEE